MAGFRGWLVAASHQIEAHVPSMLEVVAPAVHYRTKVPGWLGRLLAA